MSWNVLVGTVLCLVLSGCTSAYKASEVRSHITQFMSQFDRDGNSAANAIASREAVMKSLYSTGANKNKEPYIELNKHLILLKNIQANMLTQRKRFEASIAPVTEALKSRERILSTEPEYKLVKNMPSREKSVAKVYQNLGLKFQERAALFDSVIKREKIVEVDVPALKKQFEDAATKIKLRFSELRTQIQKDRAKVAAMPADKKPSRVAALNSMEAELKTIDSQVSELRATEASLRRELGENAKVIVGPHMESHKAIERLASIMNAIQSAVDRINVAEKSLL